MLRKIVVALKICCLTLTAGAQVKPVYTFPMEDSLLKKQLYADALSTNESLISSLDKENKDLYKEIYENRFELISSLMKSNRLVAEPDAHQYLQQVLERIVAVNEELKPLKIRLVFSRDWWANAYSVGEGTLVINAGLLLRMKSEAELAFVLCHELAHYYLDHSGKSIHKSVSLISSKQFKDDFKRLSKQEYGAGAELDKLLKVLAFGLRRHSRDNEAEADAKGIEFMRKTAFSGAGAVSCLQMLDKVDDSTFYAPLDIAARFNFPEYGFKKRWIQQESVLFGQMKGDGSVLTQQEKDSLRTHPDCQKRISTLEPVISSLPPGKDFVVDAAMFSRLKERFAVEVIEELYQQERYSLALYYSLGLLNSGQHRSYAVYSIARLLNGMYEAQLNHWLGRVTEKENRSNFEDYNLLLRMLDRLRLDELADLSYNFCRMYREEMAGYTAFETEWITAQKNKAKHAN